MPDQLRNGPRKIVCFLQNQWFKDPERIQAMINKHEHHSCKEDAHEFYIKTFLFWGCRTGQVLQQCFGPELCEEIIWQEQSPKIGGFASSKFPPDIAHIENVLRRHEPTIVIALGVSAKYALIDATDLKIHSLGRHPYELHVGPHPAARYNVFPNLREIKRKIACSSETS